MITDDERHSPVPGWCVQPAGLHGPMRGCSGSDEFEGYSLAHEARPSRYAGLGVPVAALDAMLERRPADG